MNEKLLRDALNKQMRQHKRSTGELLPEEEALLDEVVNPAPGLHKHDENNPFGLHRHSLDEPMGGAHVHTATNPGGEHAHGEFVGRALADGAHYHEYGDLGGHYHDDDKDDFDGKITQVQSPPSV